ncbi:MAG: hypothetical protein ACXABL_11705 [Candidatus Thorarchaeota archaeon]|jgi:hypothetical protein
MKRKVTRKIAVSFVLLAIALGVMANLSGVFMANTSAEDAGAGADGGASVAYNDMLARDTHRIDTPSYNDLLARAVDGRLNTPAWFVESFILGDKIVTPT